MFTFDPDARRARIHARGASGSGGSRPGEAPIDGQLVCYYPCPRCPNLARALVYLGDAALASEVVAQAEDIARHLELLAVGAGLALNGGHGHCGGRDCHLSLWTEPPATLARAAPCCSLSQPVHNIRSQTKTESESISLKLFVHQLPGQGDVPRSRLERGVAQRFLNDP